jgi:Rrf2 family protein
LFTNGSVHVSAKTDYAIRATIELASVASAGSLTAQAISAAQQIPLQFLLNILASLRRAGLVDSHRGPHGGWRLARPADEIAVSDVIRAVDGPLTNLTSGRTRRPGSRGGYTSVDELWVAVSDGIRDILERITVADLASGGLQDEVVPAARKSGG